MSLINLERKTTKKSEKVFFNVEINLRFIFFMFTKILLNFQDKIAIQNMIIEQVKRIKK